MSLSSRIGARRQGNAGVAADEGVTAMAVLAVVLMSLTLAGEARAGKVDGSRGSGQSEGTFNPVEGAPERDRGARHVATIGSTSGPGKTPQRAAPRGFAGAAEFATSAEVDPSGLLGVVAIFAGLIAVFGVVLGIVELVRRDTD